MGRDTRTGGVLESMVLPALDKGGYKYTIQVVIGKRLGGKNHRVDVLVSGFNGEQIPVSLKWQQTAGTAEQKIPFEIMCLADAVYNSNGKIPRAYLVLGGLGWTLREYYISGKISQYVRNCEHVNVVSLETFVAKANKAQL